MPKRYNSKYDALEAVLTGTFDFRDVKTAKQIQAERAAAAKTAQEANRKKYVQMDDILTDDRTKVRLAKLQKVVDDPTTAQQEKESARKSIERIKAKGGK